MNSDPESAAISCIEAFTERLNARDPAGIDATLHRWGLKQRSY